MQYVDIDRLKQSLGEQLLVELTDADALEIKVEVLQAVNTEAVSEVHSYLQGIYKLPLANDTFIDTLIIDLMRYRLHVRRDSLNLPEIAVTLYDQILEKLKALKSKAVLLSSTLVDGETENPQDASQTGDVRHTTYEPKFYRGFTGI